MRPSGGSDQRSLSEPVEELQHVPIRECGEELIDFVARCPQILLDRPRFRYRRETLLRQTVAERLCEAAGLLPPGYRLAVIEGWRAPHIQRRMYRATWNWWKLRHPEWQEERLRREVDRFSAPLNDDVPPPHTTGGAVDIMLADTARNVLDHWSPFDEWDPQSFPFAAQGLSADAARTRGILRDALLGAGLTNYPSEYWHWSYGDQGWAYRGGHPHALYGPTQPANWRPDPGEDIDEPLEPVNAPPD